MSTTTGPTPLPFQDRTDFEDADRGHIDSLKPGMVKAADGHVA
jgi:alkyl sulfatase BDS1-like metallo-beta-lactamase superfamily hydrolase